MSPSPGHRFSAAAVAPSRVEPPATSTFPSARTVAVGYMRGVAMLPVGRHVPVAGSYSSTSLSATAAGVIPPMSRTPPIGKLDSRSFVSVVECGAAEVTRHADVAVGTVVTRGVAVGVGVGAMQWTVSNRH